MQDLTILDDVAVIIPAYNEEKKILETLQNLKLSFSNLVIVDDGSTDNTFKVIKSTGTKVVRHPINLGQGASLQTGIYFALSNPKIKYLITFDADGQHSVNDAIGMVKQIKLTKVDIILGSRFINHDSINMPKKKKLILKLAIIFTRFDSGLPVSDTHNGLRVMNRSFASKLKIKQSGMAHASEILEQIKLHGASWMEYPAQINYTPYSINKGQSIFNAINILTEMMHK